MGNLCQRRKEKQIMEIQNNFKRLFPTERGACLNIQKIRGHDGSDNKRDHITLFPKQQSYLKMHSMFYFVTEKTTWGFKKVIQTWSSVFSSGYKAAYWNWGSGQENGILNKIKRERMIFFPLRIRFRWQMALRSAKCINEASLCNQLHKSQFNFMFGSFISPAFCYL